MKKRYMERNSEFVSLVTPRPGQQLTEQQKANPALHVDVKQMVMLYLTYPNICRCIEHRHQELADNVNELHPRLTSSSWLPQRPPADVVEARLVMDSAVIYSRRYVYICSAMTCVDISFISPSSSSSSPVCMCVTVKSSGSSYNVLSTCTCHFLGCQATGLHSFQLLSTKVHIIILYIHAYRHITFHTTGGDGLENFLHHCYGAWQRQFLMMFGEEGLPIKVLGKKKKLRITAMVSVVFGVSVVYGVNVVYLVSVVCM